MIQGERPDGAEHPGDGLRPSHDEPKPGIVFEERAQRPVSSVPLPVAEIAPNGMHHAFDNRIRHPRKTRRGGACRSARGLDVPRKRPASSLDCLSEWGPTPRSRAFHGASEREGGGDERSLVPPSHPASTCWPG